MKQPEGWTEEEMHYVFAKVTVASRIGILKTVLEARVREAKEVLAAGKGK